MSTTAERINAPAAGISLWLDSYEDIFSDFDPRGYEQRTLSDDFVAELRKMCREDEAGFSEFQLLMPSHDRNSELETVISRRLHTYFRKNHGRLQHERSALRRKGMLHCIAGLFLLLLGGYISSISSGHVALHFLVITCEPAGWFFLWTGYEHLANGLSRKRSELDFYAKMARTSISFRSLP